MARRLTIAIPTYNRALLLDKQLDWLAGSIRGHEKDCEVLISDNSSTDGTDAVIRRHLSGLTESGVMVHHIKQERNLGAIRNIAFCISNARGDHVWTISDDDEIVPDAIRAVLGMLERHNDPSVIILNFSHRHHETGRRRFERCFPNQADDVASNGSVLFERYLAHPNPSRWGGLALTTALVYRTSTARDALASWHQGLDNLTVQLYVTGYCARQGKTIVTREPYLEMISGRHFFEKNWLFFAQFRYAQVPEAFVRLIALGYSPAVMRQKILEVRRELRTSLLMKLLRKHPYQLVRILLRYLRSLAAAELRVRQARTVIAVREITTGDKATGH